MRTFWAWRVVGDSRAGLPKQRVARILCARHSKRRTTNNQTPSNKDECLANPIPYGRRWTNVRHAIVLIRLVDNAKFVKPCPRRTKFGNP